MRKRTILISNRPLSENDVRNLKEGDFRFLADLYNSAEVYEEYPIEQDAEPVAYAFLVPYKGHEYIIWLEDSVDDES